MASLAAIPVGLILGFVTGGLGWWLAGGGVLGVVVASQLIIPR